MSNNKPLIKANIEGADIVIRVPVDGLVFIVENDPEFKYTVIDKAAFAKQICFQLENSKSFSNDDGMNAMEELFKNAYESVAEEGDDNVMTFSEHEWI